MTNQVPEEDTSRPDKVYLLHCHTCDRETPQLRVWSDPAHHGQMTLTCMECNTVELY